MDFKCPVWNSKQEENPTVTLWSKTWHRVWIVYYQGQLYFLRNQETLQSHSVFTKCPLCNAALCKCFTKSLSDIWKTAVSNGAAYFNSAVVLKHKRDGISIAFENATIKTSSLWLAQGNHNRGKKLLTKTISRPKKEFKNVNAQEHYKLIIIRINKRRW